jgi:hypothetical protein
VVGEDADPEFDPETDQLDAFGEPIPDTPIDDGDVDDKDDRLPD